MHGNRQFPLSSAIYVSEKRVTSLEPGKAYGQLRIGAIETRPRKLHWSVTRHRAAARLHFRSTEQWRRHRR
ncbi:hypothetical protein HALA3H3_720006 [Halomonas sp. A3H3]|nr:conserved hypothetical protein [Halomonas sp. 59]CAD5250738.1 conserved hypothetical protein [Halomonas sp. 113]CAD5257370.1 conserved hypothetical protein [Halomonas sp. I3]CAD5297369.1 conserved hypothetical protein [Halomonas sp. 156]CDG54306.1 hypothetical protein HALA3H3_720006 [Halomonas sp. A3H3]VXA97065.1 conserved hypothetical protein [Halomonas titanicae]